MYRYKGIWILDTGYWILDAGYWILDAGYWILDIGYWMLDTTDGDIFASILPIIFDNNIVNS